MVRNRFSLLFIAFLASLIIIQAGRYSLHINSLIMEWALVLLVLSLIVFSFRLGLRRIRKNREIKSSKLLGNLSKREIEILTLMVEGFSNKEIGEELFIAESTVKKHSSNIFLKLNVARRTQAIRIVTSKGMIPK